MSPRDVGTDAAKGSGLLHPDADLTYDQGHAWHGFIASGPGGWIGAGFAVLAGTLFGADALGLVWQLVLGQTIGVLVVAVAYMYRETIRPVVLGGTPYWQEGPVGRWDRRGDLEMVAIFAAAIVGPTWAAWTYGVPGDVVALYQLTLQALGAAYVLEHATGIRPEGGLLTWGAQPSGLPEPIRWVGEPPR